MSIDYFLLGVFITLVIIALASLATFLSIRDGLQQWKKKSDALAKEKQRIHRQAQFIPLILFIASTLFAYGIYNHLNSETMQGFIWWYLMGFISRLPLLIYREDILSSHITTRWSEVLITFVTAPLGLIQIPITIIGIRKHKRQ
jgi:uncharacterized membrane protein YdjX (TVP38/TMEM64 family)